MGVSFVVALVVEAGDREGGAVDRGGPAGVERVEPPLVPTAATVPVDVATLIE